jgi:hypothetical protein
MRHYYNKNRKNLLIICPILNLQGCKLNNITIMKNCYIIYTCDKYQDKR